MSATPSSILEGGGQGSSRAVVKSPLPQTSTSSGSLLEYGPELRRGETPLGFIFYIGNEFGQNDANLVNAYQTEFRLRTEAESAFGVSYDKSKIRNKLNGIYVLNELTKHIKLSVRGTIDITTNYNTPITASFDEIRDKIKYRFRESNVPQIIFPTLYRIENTSDDELFSVRESLIREFNNFKSTLNSHINMISGTMVDENTKLAKYKGIVQHVNALKVLLLNDAIANMTNLQTYINNNDKESFLDDLLSNLPNNIDAADSVDAAGTGLSLPLPIPPIRPTRPAPRVLAVDANLLDEAAVRPTDADLADLIRRENNNLYYIPGEPHTIQIKRAVILNKILDGIYSSNPGLDRASYNSTAANNISSSESKEDLVKFATVSINGLLGFGAGENGPLTRLLTLKGFSVEDVDGIIRTFMEAYGAKQLRNPNITDDLLLQLHTLKADLKRQARTIMNADNSAHGISPILGPIRENEENTQEEPVAAARVPELGAGTGLDLTSLSGAPNISRPRTIPEPLLAAENRNTLTGLVGEDEEAAKPPIASVSKALPAIPGAVPAGPPANDPFANMPQLEENEEPLNAATPEPVIAAPAPRRLTPRMPPLGSKITAIQAREGLNTIPEASRGEEIGANTIEGPPVSKSSPVAEFEFPKVSPNAAFGPQGSIQLPERLPEEKEEEPVRNPLEDLVAVLASITRKAAEEEIAVPLAEPKSTIADGLVGTLASLGKKPTETETPVEAKEKQAVLSDLVAVLAGLSKTEGKPAEPSLVSTVNTGAEEVPVALPAPQVVPAAPGIDTSRIQNLVAVLAGLRSGQPIAATTAAATPTSQSAAAPAVASAEGVSSLVGVLSELNRPGVTTPAVAARASRLAQFMQRQRRPTSDTKQAVKSRPSLFPTRRSIMTPVPRLGEATTPPAAANAVGALSKPLVGTPTLAPGLAANTESDLGRLVAEFAAFKKSGTDKIQGEIKALKAELRTAEALPKSQRETDTVRTRREELKALIAQYDEQLKKLQRNLASIDSKGMIALLEQKRDGLQAELDLLSAGEYLDIFGDLYHTRIIHPVDTEYTIPSLGSINQLFANYRMTLYRPDKLKRVLEVLSKYFNRNSPTFTMLVTDCPSEDLRILMPLFYNRLATLEQQILRSSFAASPMKAAQTTPAAHFYREIYDKLKAFISTMETTCGTRIPRTVSRREAIEEYLEDVLQRSLFATTEAFLHHIFSNVEAGTLRAELATTKGQLETAQAELGAAKAQADELAAKSKEQMAKLKELEKAKELSAEKRKKLVEDVQLLNKEKAELNRKLIAALKGLTTKQEEDANEEANNASSTAGVSNAEELQQEMAENLSAIIGELENDNGELERRITQLDGWLEEGAGEVEGLEEAIGLLEDELVAANATIAELQAELAETQRQVQVKAPKANDDRLDGAVISSLRSQERGEPPRVVRLLSPEEAAQRPPPPAVSTSRSDGLINEENLYGP